MIKAHKKSIIAGIIVLLFALLLYFYSYFIRIYIDKDPVYVIACVYSIDNDSDGLDFKFCYKYNGVSYYHGIGSLYLHRQKSLILLKISRRNPDLWIHIEKDLPECIVTNPDFDKSWKSIPTCENNK